VRITYFPEQDVTEVVRLATSSADFDAFGGLIAEYVGWCRARYQELGGFIDQVFGHQALGSELRLLSEKYTEPNGRAFLAERDGQVTGCGAYRRFAPGTCEMKRLFVPDRFRRQGTGRLLCGAIIEAARHDGYELMRLDTGDRFTEAIAMYESFGFTHCAPHLDYPAELMPYVVFMEMQL
jgi:GNAT superfamily N-acetyltransferase